MKPINHPTRTVLVIDITNACHMRCSNCTRFVGHWSKDQIFFMDLDCFESAVLSVKKLAQTTKCMIGVLGGEPTIHPEFQQICKVLQKHIPRDRTFLATTTTTKQYHDNINLIGEVFGNINQNDHVTNPIKHTPFLTAMEDFEGLTESDKEKLIDQCWVQNEWSAGINPKGAFFCEIAGMLSLLFDGPDGWDFRKDDEWWNKPIEEYEEQKNWACNKCGGCLPLRPRKSLNGTDDVSISNLQRLKKVNSPKIEKGKYEIFDTNPNEFNFEQFGLNKRNKLWYWGDVEKKEISKSPLNWQGKRKPLLSCLLVTGVGHEKYQRYDYLKMSLDSYGNQTYKNKELCVVYGGDDNYKKYVEKLISQHENVNSIYINKWFNRGRLMNICKELSSGEVLLQYDDDDDFHKDTFEFQINYMLEKEINSSCHGRLFYTFINQKKTYCVDFTSRKLWGASNTLMYFDEGKDYNEYNKYDNSIDFSMNYVKDKLYEDVDMKNHYIDDQIKIINRKPMFNYIIHDDNLTQYDFETSNVKKFITPKKYPKDGFSKGFIFDD